ncbi:nucleotidyltransferase family protein [Methanonatronarchaeum sp. AMET-Sl]|uniref:nucleotidyltransferase family protein n=1 Tax=Methanonatronarchaeum sp. AMET-Sl TaxID=3037654 RepID=UPI00244E3FA3|nr:nucleotidyltransferase family protein [Methanonatronarchaeum sp. AMET-Sl]WGI17669.1 nucleotidyltransferase family protein [Methanonatronarchaeum sp. AMET-Sl]
MVDKAVVLAAGRGTRLRPITNAIPKEMIRVGRKPTIEHVLRVLKEGGIDEVLIVVGRKKNAIIDYVGSGDILDMNVYYRVQEEPRGTADAAYLAKDFIEDDFALVYGDNYITPYNSMQEIVDYHHDNDSSGTLVLHPVDDPTRFGIVDLNQDNKVLGMVEKPSMEEAMPYKRDGHWLNIAGLMILDQEIFRYIEEIEPGKDNELWLTDAIEQMRKDNNTVKGYEFNGTRFDIGTFKSLRQADKKEQERTNNK